jgi:ATP-dependent helicase/nuclease subunit B
MILTKENINSINIDEIIDSKIKSNLLESLLIIVPTNRKLRQLKKRIIKSYNAKPVVKINIETFTTITTKILNYHKPFISLSEAAASVLIKQSAEETKLNYFAAYSNGIPFGTLDRIKNVISEYKKHGISYQTLLDESEKLEGGEKSKAIDIATIYKLYKEKCLKLSAYEIGDIYAGVIALTKNEFVESFGNYFSNVDTILVDGFDEFTNPEINILEKFSTLENKKVFINFDYHIYNQSLFSHLDDSYAKLEKFGFKRITDTSPLQKNEFNKIIRSNLFQLKESFSEIKNFENSIFKIEPKNRFEEVEFIAKKIKNLLLKNKVKPEQICVVFNIIGNYSNNIRDIFGKYNIPLNLTDRIQLKSSPPIVAAISLLELIESDFYYTDIARVLTNGFLEFKNIDLNNLLAVAAELKITSGQANWNNFIEDALILLEFNNELLESEKEQKRSRFKKAGKDISFLNALLKPLRKRNTIDEFLKVFKKILLQLKLPCKLLDNSFGKEEEYIKSVTVLLQTLTEVLSLIKKEEGEEKKYSINYFIEQLRTISNWARFNVKEKSDYGVLVTSVNEIRGLNFDYLFIGGMCDGDFPTKYSPEIFFSGSFQKKELIHQTEERYHFYQALTSWNKQLFLLTPMADGDSELVASTFVKDLQKLITLSKLNSASENKIYSKEELLIELGKNSDNSNLKNAAEKENINLEELLSSNKIGLSRRYNPFEENIFNGFIKQNINNKKIEEFLEKLLNKELSSSQLEILAKCPFKYFSEKILKLKPIEEPKEEAEPIELGNVLHSILYEFYSNISNRNIIISKTNDKEFAELKNLLFEIAEEKINKLHLHSPLAFFEKEKILGIDGVKENSILYKFLLEEKNNEDSFVPSFFEFSFGTFSREENNKEKIPPLKIGKLKLRGKIDRIDVDEKNKMFNILDYKLRGKKPNLSEISRGISLQLLVYLIAGKHILDILKKEDYKAYKMFIYSLKYSNKEFGPIQINLTRKRKITDEERIEFNEEFIESTKKVLQEYYTKIGKGKFHLSELEDRENQVCRYCDFRSFCRFQEVFE